MTTPPRRPSAAARATRRSRRPAARQATFLERNRSRLTWIGGGLIFVLLAGVAFYQFTRPVYACLNIFDPTPAPSFDAATPEPPGPGETPGPAPTAPPPGYIQPDMGALHVPTGDFIQYTHCPPASGEHYNALGIGPIQAGVYGQGDQTVPNGWVHNLEHAALVVLYRCPGDACTDEGEQALDALFAQLPESPICKVPANSLHVITRFDDMPWPYAAIVWDVVLPLQTLDVPAILDFYAQRGDRFNPEDPAACVQPTPTPGPTATPGPTSASPAPSPASSPVASPGSSPAPGSS